MSKQALGVGPVREGHLPSASATADCCGLARIKVAARGGCGLQVAAWLTQRAQAVEEMTGQLHTAAQLLRLAHQFEPDDALARHLSTVASLQDGLQGTLVHQSKTA